ncbi:phosphatidylglycerol lysyltransferase domain-containing protein [Polaromonas sp. P2-4]|nr:phosphatidylglycerol lysyltransferase domain-containing protein [Polaromonas sp. P2-4]
MYPAAQFRSYSGGELSKKRNLVKQLMTTHAVTVEPYTTNWIGDAMQILAGWMKAKGKAKGEADELACIEALQFAPRLELAGFLYQVDSESAGFLLAQCIRPGVWVMRFAKGLDRFKGIYQYMFQHFCRAMPDVQWLNFEQDMGIANLRRTKLSYEPRSLIPKFRVRLRAC